MNNEIKEILDNLIRYRNEDNKYQPEDILIIEDVWLLLDYITNLQELCNKYEEEHSNEFQCWKKDRKELLDRKAKMEKAVEIAKRLQRDYDYMLEDLIFLLSTGGDE